SRERGGSRSVQGRTGTGTGTGTCVEPWARAPVARERYPLPYPYPAPLTIPLPGPLPAVHGQAPRGFLQHAVRLAARQSEQLSRLALVLRAIERRRRNRGHAHLAREPPAGLEVVALPVPPRPGDHEVRALGSEGLEPGLAQGLHQEIALAA